MAAILALAATIPSPVFAQARDAMMTCARIVDDAERVLCYDRLVAEMSAEGKRIVAERQVKTDALVAEREAARKAEAEARQRERFGSEGLGFGADGERLEALQSNLVEALTDRAGLLVFLLENGQVWRQTDGVFRGNLKPGTGLTIKRTRLGGYLMTFPDTNRTVNVKRVR
ncbi:hypothetical protein [Thermaurantiacus sp.]